jgi:hypothetical protein
LVVEEGKTELFNLAADPGEAINLAGQQAALVEDLRGELAAWERDVGPRRKL